MRYYIIAGEASGDLHGARLVRSLKETDPDAEVRFWGGDLMQKEGGTLIRHIREISFMGFWEVLKNITSVISSFRLARRDIKSYQPDGLILIDYPGFNLRMAKYASGLGIKVFYYISPKVWAWNQSRVGTIKRYVDHMFTIFPFETDFYKAHNYKVDYVGNPLLDSIEGRPCKGESFNSFIKRNRLPDKPIISVLAGSRKQEIENCLPVMLSVMRYYPEYQFVIAGAPSIDPGFYSRFTSGRASVISGETLEILQQSSASMVVSGTATLEAALLNVPTVVCYRGSSLSIHIARRFIRVRFISLVNLIMDKEVVKELIQDDLNRDQLRTELDKILFDNRVKKTMLDDFDDLKRLLGKPGASARAAGKIYEYLTAQ